MTLRRPALNWAWAVSAPLHGWNSSRLTWNHSRSSRRRVLCSQLTTDEEVVVESAARASYHLSTNNVSEAVTADLHSFCAVKGIAIKCNPWDRAQVLSAAQAYVEDERIARLKKGARWEAMSDPVRVRLCHAICNGEGDVTYADPATGYTVFSYFGHLKRGNCCGVREYLTSKGYERTHRCRHCPYTVDGRLDSKNAIALQDRVNVIECTRKRAQEFWNGAEASVSTQVSVSVKSNICDQVASDTTRRNRESVLGSHLRKKVDIEYNKDPEDCECIACLDEQVVTCTRCNGWTYLFSPQLMKCPQCTARGFHACMECTPFRPPSLSSFYS